ncbi:hypothetical protein N752_25195 [Desulforamulus aquiferis]|nr:hypothetical protein N752_25195 [Desulforamulus aquiferis]
MVNEHDDQPIESFFLIDDDLKRMLYCSVFNEQKKYYIQM